MSRDDEPWPRFAFGAAGRYVSLIDSARPRAGAPAHARMSQRGRIQHVHSTEKQNTEVSGFRHSRRLPSLAAGIAVLAGVFLSACGDEHQTPPSQEPESLSRHASAAAPPDSPGGDPATTPPTTGPESPEPQTSYPIAIHSHCGIEFVDFGGRRWKAEEPVPAPTPRPDSEGVVSVDGDTPGMMTLLDPDTLQFTADDEAVREQGITVRFHPTDDHVPPCA